MVTVKKNLSFKEIQYWREYIHKRGSLNTGRRVEQALGNFSAMYLSSKGATDVDAKTFMPHEDDEEPTSFEEERMKALRKKESA